MVRNLGRARGRVISRLSTTIREEKSQQAFLFPREEDSARECVIFYVTTIASGWCKVLKALYGFNLTVTWSGLFHKLFNRLVENPLMRKVEKDQQRVSQHLEVCHATKSIISS